MEVVARKSFYKEANKCPQYIQEKANEVIHILENSANLQSSGLDYQKCEGSKKEKNY